MPPFARCRESATNPDGDAQTHSAPAAEAALLCRPCSVLLPELEQESSPTLPCGEQKLGGYPWLQLHHARVVMTAI